MSELAFELGQKVRIKVSDEAGEIIGIALYAAQTENSYLVRYKAADGRAVENWWNESALAATD